MRGMKWLPGGLVERPAFAICLRGVPLGSCRSVHVRLGMRLLIRALCAFVEWQRLVEVAWEEPPVRHVLFSRGGCLRVVEVWVERSGHVLLRVH